MSPLFVVLHNARLGGMRFFEEIPAQWSSGPPTDPLWDPPIGEFPHVAVSDALLLARTESVAVAVTAVWAFKEGFEFWVSTQFRNSTPSISEETDSQSLHIGLEFADGRKVANVRTVPSPAGSVPNGLLMRVLGMGGRQHHRNRSYWVWPLPPPGPLAFVCEWATYDISERRAEIDAQLILDAAAHSIKVWS